MIATTPSYIDPSHSLSDDSLYPQQLATMYNVPRFPVTTYAQQQQQYDTYDVSQSPNVNPNANPNAHAMFAQPMTEPDFHNASFSDVGAAFGFNPDLPIQINPTQQLPQSPTALIPGYNAPFQPQPQPHMFTPSVPLGDGYPVGGEWSRGAASGGGPSKRQRVLLPDESDEDMLTENQRPTRL